MDILVLFLGYVLLLSVITFMIYAWDKKKAENGKWRTKEKTLLSFSFFGGAIGGLLAMFKVRHKNKKWYFRLTNFAGLALIIIVGILIIINLDSMPKIF